MSHGTHRATKPVKPRRSLRRLAAGLGLAAATATAITLTADLTITPQADSGWGAPDTTHIAVDTGTTDGIQASVHVDDTGWG